MNQTAKNTILKEPEAGLFGKLAVGLASSIVDPFEYTVEFDGSYNDLASGLNEYFLNNLSCTEISSENVGYDINLEIIEQNHATSAEEEENDIYFYHTDHLGSSSWITYTDGSVTQHMQNLPFGEPFIDQRATSYDIRYKFTGKEMDSETGYQYFGARYYNSDISVWLSVDPKASHFPHISSYNYVEQNPLKYIDKKGENPIGALVGGLIGAATEVVGQTVSNGFGNLENGKGFFNEWGKQMDWADVGISTAEGALTGLTMGASLGVTAAIKGGSAIARSSIDWKGNDKTPNVIFAEGDFKKDWTEFGYDLAGEAISAGLSGFSGLNSVDFVDFDAPDLSGSLMKAFVEGSFDGLWKLPTSIYKKDYIKRRNYEPIDITINLPAVEVYPLSHEKANENQSIVNKEAKKWFEFHLK